jgi:transketolase
MFETMEVDSATKAQSIQAHEIRRIVLEQSRRANVGHIGSALCVAELLAVLYGRVLRIPSPADPDRDRFILSKGHAALALYAALHLKGWIDLAELNTYCGDGSLLGVHPERSLAGIDFSTGSLGHGLSMGAGAALAARLQGSARRVFTLLSDAECNEGSLWEAAMFAAHHRLASLTAIVDVNGQQALGRTAEVLNLEPLRARWSAFGWDAVEIDGHDPQAIAAALETAPGEGGPPRVVLAWTVFGRGVSYMEDQVRWHYWPMSEDEYRQALGELERAA